MPEEGENMKPCDNCIWFVYRELTDLEKQFLRWNPGMMIDNRICALGGCNGDRYEGKTE